MEANFQKDWELSYANKSKVQKGAEPNEHVIQLLGLCLASTFFC